MSDGDYRYWAFISYSHQDKAWGDWLHKTLENYRVPGRLAGRASRDGQVPKRLYPIFRDREELPSSADLGNNISDALRRSRYLVVICSPHAAPSRWVNEEIKSFKKLGREDRILALIVDGEPNASDKPDSGMAECFPAALSHKLDARGELSSGRVEPIAADARAGKDGRANAALKLIAGLLGVGYDELKQRERQRRIRRRLQWGATALLLMALALGAWSWQVQREVTANYAEHGREALLRGDTTAAALYLNEAYRRGLHTPALRLMLGHALRMIVPANTVLALPGRSGIGAVSPDGGKVITLVHGKVGDGQPQWQLWDWRVGKALTGQPAGTAAIESASFAPDGARFATAAADGTVTVYDSGGGKALFTVKDMPSKLLQVAYTPDGRALLSLSDNPRASLWDATTGKRIETLPGDALDPRHVRFSADGRRLLSVSRGGQATVWDLTAKRTVLTLRPPHAPFRDAWFSAHQRFIISFDQDGGSEMWSATSGKLLKTAKGGDSRSRSVLTDADGERILTEDEDHQVAVLKVQAADEQDPEENGALDLYARSALSASEQYAIDLSRDGNLAATSTLRAGVIVWNASAGAPITNLTLPREDSYLYQLSLFPDGRHLAGVGFYGNSMLRSKMFVWDLPPSPRFIGSGIDGDMGGFISEAGERFSSMGPEGSAELWDWRDGRLLRQFGRGLTWATWLFHDDEKLVAVGRDTGAVQAWDVKDGALRLSLAPYKNITTAAFRPDGRRLFLSDGKAGCELLLGTAGPCTPLPVPRNAAQAAYTPDGRTLAVVGDQVLLWDSAQGRARGSVATPHTGELAAIAIDGAGRRLLILRKDGNVDQVDLESGTLLGSVTLPTGIYSDASLQADRQLAALTIEHKVQIWDLSGPRLKATLDNPATGKMGWFAFSPDGSLLAATDDDEHLGLYDVDSGRELVALEGSGDGAAPVFSRDGASVSQGLMGTLAIWELPPEDRAPKEIAAWLACRVPQRLEEDKLVVAKLDPTACSSTVASH